MTNKYCIQCGKHHTIEEMRLMVSKVTARWRSLESIKAAKQTLKNRKWDLAKVSKRDFAGIGVNNKLMTGYAV